jgi:hypothetical protein
VPEECGAFDSYLMRLERQVASVRADLRRLEDQLSGCEVVVATYQELLASAWSVIEELRGGHELGGVRDGP